MVKVSSDPPVTHVLDLRTWVWQQVLPVDGLPRPIM
jgi:hypothetical protein